MANPLSSQFTDSFAELLRQSGGSLVVSTYQSGHLVVVRSQGNGVNTHFVPFKKPMGMAHNGSQLSVGGATEIVHFRNLPAVAAKLGEPAHDACYLARGSHVTGNIDVHEMGFDAEGELWLVNTRMSCLCTISPEFNVVPRWRPPFVSAYELTDRCHLNGMAFRDGKPRYVSALGETDKAGGWRMNKTSGGLLMDIESNEKIVDGLCMPHSPRWYRDRLWFLQSGAGRLMVMDPGGKPEIVADLPGFTRGLDFIGRYALIGLSQVRESAVFAGLPLTQRVEERQCGVWVVDIETGAVVAFLAFTGGVQEVFEVKVLPHRFPVVLETNHALIANSFELPDEALKQFAKPDPTEQRLEAATRDHLQRRFDDAITAYKAILADHPEHQRAKHQLGLCMVDAERWLEGLEVLGEVTTEQPDNAEAWNSLGLCYARLGQYEESIELFDKSIETDRQFALGHFNRGMVLLKLGRLAEAWSEYDWRWQTPQFVPFNCSQPLWKGEDISDKRLLVHSEQGNGDHVQFWRFLPMVAKMCKELIYVGPEKLSPLVGEIEGISENRLPGSIPNDRFDVYCPLMSLPEKLGITLDNIPAEVPYIKVPDQVVVSKLEGDFKVGFAWEGSATHKDDHRRSARLDHFLPLLAIPGTRFFSLQMPITSGQAETLKRHRVHNLEPELPGYARTAALIDQLDLVISVDTSVVHVAGALAKETWVLLAQDADWRWLLEGDESPWYPTARLFRQREAGDWDEVMERVRMALEERLRAA